MLRKLLVIFSLVLVFYPVNVSAYKLSGYYWSSWNLRHLGWWVSDDAYYRDYIRFIFRRAAESWENLISKGSPNFYEESFRPHEYASILIYTYNYSDSDTLAYVKFTTWGSKLVIVRIYINIAPLEKGYYIDDYHFQAVLAHEIGHVLGLAHESRYGPTVLMYGSDGYYVKGRIYMPQEDDRNGLIALYG